MKLAWYLPTLPSVKWKIATQLGVEYAVAALPAERYYMTIIQQYMQRMNNNELVYRE